MSSEIEKFLQDLNAELDVVKQSEKEIKYFLKIRSFPTSQILKAYQWGESTQHTDDFYDTTQMDKLRQTPKHFYRRRGEIVLQISEDVKRNSHCYSEEYLTPAQFEQLRLSLYLSYTFSRQYGEISKDKKYEVYIDTIASPFYYRLVTWKIELVSDDIRTVRETVSALRIPEFHPLPVYTKFMYKLQCSELFPVYEELFESSLHYVETEMKIKLSSEAAQATVDSQHYLWSFGQLVHFQVLYDDLHDTNEVYRGINKIKNQVYQNIENNIFGLHIVNEEKEEMVFC
jgi:hypothetical protein